MLAPRARAPDSGELPDASLSLDAAGPVLRARVARRGAPLEVVARATWRSGRAAAEAELGPLGELARHAAHRLCRAARRDVAFELALGGLSPERAREIVESLVHETARALEERRLHAALETSREARALLARDRGLEAQVAHWLATPTDLALAATRPRAEWIAREHFGGRVRLFAPLYLADACQNDCAYCGFRRSHARRRVQLSVDDAVREAAYLNARGLCAIDLVTGEVPTDRFVDGVARATERILAETLTERVHLNLGALSPAQYRRLRAAGAAGYHLYQETYDPETYFAVHREGPKRDMAHRLEAPWRAIEAGFDSLGLGVLLGLGEPERDLAALARHAERLAVAHPRVRLGISLPRFRAVDHGCSFAAPHPVDDALFVKALLWLRTRLPAVELTLTTREGPALRDALLPLGVTKLSAGVSTAPGGYASAAPGTAQFTLGDERSVGEVVEAVFAADRMPALA